MRGTGVWPLAPTAGMPDTRRAARFAGNVPPIEESGYRGHVPAGSSPECTRLATSPFPPFSEDADQRVFRFGPRCHQCCSSIGSSPPRRSCAAEYVSLKRYLARRRPLGAPSDVVNTNVGAATAAMVLYARSRGARARRSHLLRDALAFAPSPPRNLIRGLSSRFQLRPSLSVSRSPRHRVGEATARDNLSIAARASF